MPRRGTSKDAVAPLPQCPTGPFGRSQTPEDGGLRQPQPLIGATLPFAHSASGSSISTFLTPPGSLL